MTEYATRNHLGQAWGEAAGRDEDHTLNITSLESRAQRDSEEAVMPQVHHYSAEKARQGDSISWQRIVFLSGLGALFLIALGATIATFMSQL
ncbi:MAG: hypothetical protein ABWY00_11115 [Dongiaceae bacterium]